MPVPKPEIALAAVLEAQRLHGARRRPLRTLSRYVMVMILAELDDAMLAGYTADELARHLVNASELALRGKVVERRRLALVLREWANLLDADADAEAQHGHGHGGHDA